MRNTIDKVVVQVLSVPLPTGNPWTSIFNVAVSVTATIWWPRKNKTKQKYLYGFDFFFNVDFYNGGN